MRSICRKRPEQAHPPRWGVRRHVGWEEAQAGCEGRGVWDFSGRWKRPGLDGAEERTTVRTHWEKARPVHAETVGCARGVCRNKSKYQSGSEARTRDMNGAIVRLLHQPGTPFLLGFTSSSGGVPSAVHQSFPGFGPSRGVLGLPVTAPSGPGHHLMVGVGHGQRFP